MPTARPVSRRLLAVTAAACLTVAMAACGDDDTTAIAVSQTTTTTTATAAENADLTSYCAQMDEINNQDGPPTEAQLTEVKSLAPAEVADDVTTVADAFIAADGDMGKVFGDPTIEEAMNRVDQHNVDLCGFDPPQGQDTPEADTAPAEGAQVIPVTAVDYAFEGIPEQVSAGKVAFQFTDKGESAHEMIIIRLGDGADLDQLLASDEEPPEDQAKQVGSTFASPGGDPTYANVDLEPGRYAVVCFLPGPGGKPHFSLGMKQTFVVS